MSFTKVAPAGIGTNPGTSIRIGDSLLHSTGIDIGTGSGIGVTIRQHGNATFTGIVTASSFSGDITGKATELATNATGTNLTLSGNLGVGGVVTYEDVTNIDSVGVITARSGIKIGPTAGVAGTFFADGSYVTAGVITATTFYGSGANLTGIDTDLVSDTSPQLGGDLQSNGHDIKIADASGYDGNNIYMGTGNDVRIHHDGSNFSIAEATGDVTISAADDIFLKPQASENGIRIIGNGAVELYHDNAKTAWTHSSGFNIKGGNTSDNTELIITGNEGQPASILMSADDGDDNADHWRMYSNADNSFTLNSYSSGSYQSILKGTSSRSIELNYQGSKKFETTSSGTSFAAGTAVFNGPSGTSYTAEIKPTNSNPYGLACIEPSSFNNGYPLLAVTNNSGQTYFRTLSGGISEARNIQPAADNTYDLGTSSVRWRNLYTTDLQLSNEGKTNDVDGTWGNYTIQEGESDLFLINNRNGKKYKFNLTEVS